MTAAARKKQVVVETAPAVDDPRSALAAAIVAHSEAQSAVEAKKQTIRRALEGVGAAETRLEHCRASVAKAKEQDVKSAATHFDKSGTPDSPWHLRRAISEVEMAETSLEVADAAHKKLKNDLRELEDNAAECANQILIEIRLLTLPIVQKLLAESVGLKQRLHTNQRLLNLPTEHGHRNDQPSFHDEMRGMRAAEQRDVLGTLRAEVQNLAFGWPDDVTEVLAVWKEVLAALRTNSDVEFPRVED
jgi:hypothetical protein